MKIIYEPKGRAREYAELACNLYSGCDHGCTYCYAPLALKRQRESFSISTLRPINVIRELSKDVEEMKKNQDTRSVLLCFTCDAYQKLNDQHHITRQAIKIFIENGIRFTILTKGGTRSLQDIDLLKSAPELATYAATLVFLNEAQRERYEPGATSTQERIEVLKTMHDAGITTWVSLEPVFDPEQTFEIIRKTHEFVDLYKVGKVNYMPEGKSIDWHKFTNDAISLLDSMNKNYYIKNDLKAYL